jgi:sulfonate transport system permease protein
MRLVSRVPGPAELAPREHRRRWRLIDVGLGIAVPVVLILLWQLASSQDWIDDRLYPSPTDVVSKGIDMWQEDDLWSHLFVSIRRTLLGFLLGTVTGAAVGLVMGMSRLVRSALEPMLNALYTVPKLALIGPIFIILGFGEKPIVVLIAITVFFFVWISTLAAILSVDPGYREAARSLNVNSRQMFRHVLLPAALPQIFVGLRIAAGVSVLMLIGVEFVIANEGIGYLIEQGRSQLRVEQTFVGIVLAALMGVVFISLVRLIGRLLIPWASEDTTEARI